MKIQFSKQTDFESVGRNGLIKTTGIDITEIGDSILLAPITSRGALGRATIAVAGL